MTMVLHFKTLIRHFFGFLKNPNAPDYVDISKDQKLLNVSFYYLIIQFVVSAFILWYPVEIAEKLGLYNRLEEIDYKTGVATIVISAVILAPLIEEGYSGFHWDTIGKKLISSGYITCRLCYLDAFIFLIINSITRITFLSPSSQ